MGHSDCYFSLFGFIVPASPEIEKQLLELIKEILAKTQGMSAWQLVRFIFLNNVQASFFGLVLGVVLGIFPVFFAIAVEL